MLTNGGAAFKAFDGRVWCKDDWTIALREGPIRLQDSMRVYGPSNNFSQRNGVPALAHQIL